jgi:hypothetical protein
VSDMVAPTRSSSYSVWKTLNTLISKESQIPGELIGELFISHFHGSLVQAAWLGAPTG